MTHGGTRGGDGHTEARGGDGETTEARGDGDTEARGEETVRHGGTREETVTRRHAGEETDTEARGEETVRHEGTRGGEARSHTEARGGEGDGHTRRHAGRRDGLHTEAGEGRRFHTERNIKRDSTLIRNCARRDTMECI